MLLFCPSCSNVLTVSKTKVPMAGVSSHSTATEDSNRLECLTCPYQYILTKRYYERKNFERVDRTVVYGGDGQFDNAPKTTVQCDKSTCDGMEANFYELQIRSADEPMTIFFRCKTCKHQWRV